MHTYILQLEPGFSKPGSMFFITNNPTQSDYYREEIEAIALVSATAPFFKILLTPTPDLC